MASWISMVSGWVLFGLALFCWVRWTNLEREKFASENWRHLE
ncbi:MAG TPA: hypothetical protein VLM91_13440 [Candidatus Methylomirabilis sp.]|nr:hypothetical protein [Candidatus Methylomirabilis sp.]